MRRWRLGHTLRASLTRLSGSVRLRLLVRVLFFSSLVTLTLTATQLYLEYRRGVGSIERRLDNVEKSYRGSLAEGLWRLDEEYLQVQLDGILRLPDIAAVEVREIASSGTPLVVTAGRRGIHSVLDREFPISYRVQGQEQLIGTFFVEATLANLYQELMKTALVILVSQGLKTFLVSLFIIYMVHRLITRHLAAFADYARDYDLRRPPPPFRLQRQLRRQTDELDQVVDAFNAMCANLLRAYGELREREARIRRLVEANIIGIFFWNLAGRILEANDAMLALIGYSRADLLSGRLAWKDMTPPEYRAADAQAAAELAACGACRPYEKEYIAKDGHRVPVLVAGALFEGSPDQGVAFVLDLSQRQRAEAERRAREAAEAANRAKSEFLAHMSHELRTPLNTILGFARLISEDSSLPETVREDLVLIMKSGEHLHSLINHVLDLSKLEAGRLALEEVDFDLDLLLGDLRDMFAPQAVRKGLRLVFSPRQEVPQWIHADPLKLRQVLINLINNAIKFTAHGEVTVRVETLSRSADRCRLAFAVADTGPGISPAEQEELFDAFVQAQAGRQARQGSGLGLAISRGFVRLMGGDLRVGSEVGKGATFSFAIPVGIAPEPIPAHALPHPVRQVAGLAPGAPRYRLLVVDDHPEGRQLLLRILGPVGFELQEAENGQEAVARWRDWRPDLIWMDMRMPVLDGREATRRIRAEAGERQPVIVALTASSFEEERADILAAGCDDFLRKPYQEADLFALLEKHLGARFTYRLEAEAEFAAEAPAAAAVAGLPRHLRQALEQSLVGLDTAAVERAIKRIRKLDPELADTLSALAQNFQYEQILSLIEASAGEMEND